jgi:hypothetical protein
MGDFYENLMSANVWKGGSVFFAIVAILVVMVPML